MGTGNRITQSGNKNHQFIPLRSDLYSFNSEHRAREERLSNGQRCAGYCDGFIFCSWGLSVFYRCSICINRYSTEFHSWGILFFFPSFDDASVYKLYINLINTEMDATSVTECRYKSTELCTAICVSDTNQLFQWRELFCRIVFLIPWTFFTCELHY